VRGILAQKPLAMSVRDAKDVAERCQKAGITLAVNQNMRYDQSVRALKDILQRGWLGEPVLGTIEMRAIPHWMPWSEKLHSRWTEVWFPDAFVGTMAQLLCAVEEGTEPEISGRDNLETIALCEAVFAAAKEHRVTTVREFLT